MIFTQAEIEAAKRNPRVGDVWERAMWRRTVVDFDWVGRLVTYLGMYCVQYTCSLGVWRGWTRNATLVSRGDV